MAPFLRKITTTSGANAVELVEKVDCKNLFIEHLGSVHTDAELAILLQLGCQKLHAGQDQLDLGYTSQMATTPAAVGG